MSAWNQEQEHQVGVFEARKRIIKLLTEQEYQAGVKDERERIIKLLESIYDYPKDWDYDNPIESVIALIKGENK